MFRIECAVFQRCRLWSPTGPLYVVWVVKKADRKALKFITGMGEKYALFRARWVNIALSRLPNCILGEGIANQVGGGGEWEETTDRRKILR
jgi:hypothetical protein